MRVSIPLAIATVLLATATAAFATETPAPAWNPDAWKANFNADGTPKPLKDPRDTKVWPNRKSFANSDPWIAANHDRLRQMRPRILLINLANYAPEGKPMDLARQLIAISTGDAVAQAQHELERAMAFREQGQDGEAAHHAVRAYELLYFDE